MHAHALMSTHVLFSYTQARAAKHLPRFGNPRYRPAAFSPFPLGMAQSRHLFTITIFPAHYFPTIPNGNGIPDSKNPDFKACQGHSAACLAVHVDRRRQSNVCWAAAVLTIRSASPSCCSWWSSSASLVTWSQHIRAYTTMQADRALRSRHPTVLAASRA